MSTIIPKNYSNKLLPETTEIAIKRIKDHFQTRLADALNLRRVTAPLFVTADSGLNDNLNGIERPVSFKAPSLDNVEVQIVHSLAKWKRLKLADYHISPGYGIYTDMNAIRADEQVDNLHSLYVDQWDWEKVILPGQRTAIFLQETVRKIYEAIKSAEAMVTELFPHIKPFLPDSVKFIHSEELLKMYPGLTAKERENAACREYGAVFIQGIGAELSDGSRHDGRAPDYDDWSTTDECGNTGLNGDLLVWNPVLDIAFELSSMGIRVDPDALRLQLKTAGCEDRASLPFHSRLLAGQLPSSIGGGIGQSRLCMLLLQKAHIGEVQSSLWPDDQRQACLEAGIELL